MLPSPLSRGSGTLSITNVTRHIFINPLFIGNSDWKHLNVIFVETLKTQINAAECDIYQGLHCLVRSNNLQVQKYILMWKFKAVTPLYEQCTIPRPIISNQKPACLHLKCQSELPPPIPQNSVESDHGCTSRIYFDNAGDNVTLTTQKPC